MDNFMLIVVVMYTFVKTHWTSHSKQVQFIACKLCNNISLFVLYFNWGEDDRSLPAPLVIFRPQRELGCVLWKFITSGSLWAHHHKYCPGSWNYIKGIRSVHFPVNHFSILTEGCIVLTISLTSPIHDKKRLLFQLYSLFFEKNDIVELRINKWSRNFTSAYVYGVCVMGINLLHTCGYRKC